MGEVLATYIVKHPESAEVDNLAILYKCNCGYYYVSYMVNYSGQLLNHLEEVDSMAAQDLINSCA
jgi:hypothetical protein